MHVSNYITKMHRFNDGARREPRDARSRENIEVERERELNY